MPSHRHRSRDATSESRRPHPHTPRPRPFRNQRPAAREDSEGRPRPPVPRVPGPSGRPANCWPEGEILKDAEQAGTPPPPSAPPHQLRGPLAARAPRPQPPLRVTRRLVSLRRPAGLAPRFRLRKDPGIRPPPPPPLPPPPSSFQVLYPGPPPPPPAVDPHRLPGPASESSVKFRTSRPSE